VETYFTYDWKTFNHLIFQASNPMKRMLLAVFSALCFGATAQITITNAVFPAAGDSLFYATDNQPGAIDPATPPGGNQVWDFSALKPAQTSAVYYQHAAAGQHVAAFPGAELAVLSAVSETYYNVTATKFENLGTFGGTPQSLGVQVVARNSPALIERRAPVNFFDINQQTSNLNVPFPLPDTFKQGALAAIDSVRIRVTTQYTDVVDAWGNCSIPGGTYPVLRQKHTQYTTRGVDVQVQLGPFKTWLDLSSFLGGAGGGGALGALLGTDTTVAYRFLSGTEKEEIAVATMNKTLTAVQSIRFKHNKSVLADQEADAPGSISIQAFPNPAVDWVRFDCLNLPTGDYSLKIFNILGRVVYNNSFQMSGNKSIRIELDNFRKGTYLYSLLDAKGSIISTKRLLVLKP
jgi:hypothetical protein